RRKEERCLTRDQRHEQDKGDDQRDVLGAHEASDGSEWIGAVHRRSHRRSGLGDVAHSLPLDCQAASWPSAALRIISSDASRFSMGPEMRPWCMTMMRSASASSSGISEEISMMAMPLLARLSISR